MADNRNPRLADFEEQLDNDLNVLESQSWVEWVVRYQVRRSRQDEAVSGKKWAWTETRPLEDEEWARRFAEDLRVSPGKNIRNAQAVRKTCEVQHHG